MEAIENPVMTCPECNVEMVSIGRREIKVPMIGDNGMAECAFHPNQYRCPVCQAIAYNGAELIAQLRARQKTAIGMQVIYAAEKAIDASNRLHARHNNVRWGWGIVLLLCGAIWGLTKFEPSNTSLLVNVIALIASIRISARRNFTTKEVWDEVPETASSEEQGVV